MVTLRRACILSSHIDAHHMTSNQLHMDIYTNGYRAYPGGGGGGTSVWIFLYLLRTMHSNVCKIRMCNICINMHLCHKLINVIVLVCTENNEYLCVCALMHIYTYKYIYCTEHAQLRDRPVDLAPRRSVGPPQNRRGPHSVPSAVRSFHERRGQLRCRTEQKVGWV